VLCENDDMALGAAQALKSRSGSARPIVVGADAIPDALHAIANGTMTATVEQFGDKQASTALRILKAYVQHGTRPKVHTILVPPLLITKSNLSAAVIKK
jgi:ABC-type sugar transport system substrate-binding protein